MGAHEECHPGLVAIAAAREVDLVVLDERPPFQYVTYPTDTLECPHGFTFWVMPTLAAAALLAALDGHESPEILPY